MSAYTFRHLTRDDFPLLGEWLAQPHVARWWCEDASPEGVEAEYGPGIDGTDPFEAFLAHRDGQPLGLILRYRLHDYPSDARQMETLAPIPARAVSIDYLIGEEALCGRGIGTEMIGAFVAQTWVDRPEAPAVIVPIHADNRPSWRTLERVGFERVGRGPLKPDNPADSTDHVVYRLNRPEDG